MPYGSPTEDLVRAGVWFGEVNEWHQTGSRNTLKGEMSHGHNIEIEGTEDGVVEEIISTIRFSTRGHGNEHSPNLHGTKELIVQKRAVMKWLPVLCSNDIVHGSWYLLIHCHSFRLF